MQYKKHTIKPYAVISNGYKYSVTAPNGQYVGSARTLADARYLVSSSVISNELRVTIADWQRRNRV